MDVEESWIRIQTLEEKLLALSDFDLFENIMAKLINKKVNDDIEGDSNFGDEASIDNKIE